MATLEELASIEQIKAEYRKSLLLNLLQKLVGKMKRSDEFRRKVRKLFTESTDKLITTKVLIKKNFNFDLNEEDTLLMNEWIQANLRKSDKRKRFTLDYKQELYKKQNGKCMVCGEPLGNDLSKIHIDHIIPWILVGDEIPNNYQCLCETCNESKSCHTDFIFKSLLNLN